jgi:hypothetical protein
MLGDVKKFYHDYQLKQIKDAISSDAYLIDAARIFWDGDGYNFIRLTNFDYRSFCPNLKTKELERILEEVKKEAEMSNINTVKKRRKK